jgi:hypothetical protein
MKSSIYCKDYIYNIKNVHYITLFFMQGEI